MRNLIWSILTKSVTFSSVDMVLLARRRPLVLQKVLKNVFSMFVAGTLSPLFPITTMPISEVEQAFRMMQAGKHSGKIVLTAGVNATVSAKLCPLRLDRDGTYIIAGGLGKLGRRICEHLASLGAGHILLLSRNDYSTRHKEGFDQLLSSGTAKVHVLRCDISNLQDVESLFQRVRNTFPTLRGVIHSAMVLQDSNLAQMTLNDFQASIQPKYIGTHNLLKVVRNTELDFLILLSSLSGIVGLPGQANYAAGNTYQDHVIHCNSAEKWKSFVALDMSVLTETHVVPHEKLETLRRRGMVPIRTDAILPFLDYAMSERSTVSSEGSVRPYEGQAQTPRPPDQIIIGLDMQGASEDNKMSYSKNPMFSHVFASNRSVLKPSISLRTESAIEKITVNSLSVIEKPKEVITQALAEKISSLVGLDVEKVDVNKPIANFGLDSLIAIELKNWITRILRTPMQTADILDAASIAALTDLIIQRTDHEMVDMASTTRKIEEQRSESLRKKDASSASMLNVMQVPKLPLQPLHDTLDVFYKSISVFGSPAELYSTQHAIEELCRFDGQGRVLHSRLSKLSNNDNIDSWLSDIYNDTFWLQRRAPLRPSMNFFSSHPLTVREYSQAEKAALLTLALFEFKQKLDRNEVEQEFVNDEPQCMESLNWIFNACRRPGEGRDETLRFPASDYVVAMRNGHAYKIPPPVRWIGCLAQQIDSDSLNISER